jgi:hypothetical protein
MTQKGIKKPRVSEYSKAHAVRFKKSIEKDLTVYYIDNEIRLSRIIQMAVECFLKNKDCIARKKLLEERC